MDVIEKIKIKMLSQQRIEPTPIGVEAGIKNRTSHAHREPPLYRKATESSRCILDYKRTGILTVHGFISATLRF